MFDFGPEKLLLVFVAVLTFLGPKELPAAARTIATWMRHVRSLQDMMRAELGMVLELPSPASTSAGFAEHVPNADLGGATADAHEPGFAPGPSSFT
jgi:Sec-independent protein translocase protein TatA